MSTPGACRSTAFGLTIASNVAIPGLPAAPHPRVPDVEVHLDATLWPRLQPTNADVWYVSPEHDAGIPWLTVRRDDGFTFDYSEGAVFAVSGDGSRIAAGWRAPLSLDDAASYLLGPVLAFALRLRGTLPLHASGVAIGGGAVLFVGPAGSGKSTTAAVLGTLGHPVLADDVVALRMTDVGLLAFPGHPRLSVWEDSSTAIFGPAARLPRVSEVYRKHIVDLGGRGLPVCDRPLPVEAIFLLDHRTASRAVEIAPVSERDGLVGLAGNTYGAYLLDRELRAREFEILADVVRRARPRSLRFEEGFDRLTANCDTVARSCARADGCDALPPMSS